MDCDDIKKFKSAKLTDAAKEVIEYANLARKSRDSKGYNISVDLNVETENQSSGMTYETGDTWIWNRFSKKSDVEYIVKIFHKLNKEEKRALIYSVYLKNFISKLRKDNEWIYACDGTLKMRII